MSSSEVSQDEYEYYEYYKYNNARIGERLDNWEDGRSPPLIKKRSRILLAAVQNDVETLKTLLDSPKWYKVRDKRGRNLLYITVINKSKEAFDYLLSLNNFLSETSTDKLTDVMDLPRKREYFLLELIKKGVEINTRFKKGNSLLQFAIEKNFMAIARFLIVERGVDLNAQNHKGETPLHSCCYCSRKNQDEVICMLLCCGADPFICDDEGRTPLDTLLAKKWITKQDSILVALENLAYFTVDQWSNCKIPASCLFNLIRKESPLFETLVPLLTDKTVENDVEWFDVVCLFVMKPEQLELLLERLPSLVAQVLCSFADYDNLPSLYERASLFQYEYCNSISLENFEIIGRTLPSVLVDFVSKINSTKLINNLIGFSYNCKYSTTQIIFYLLSYGMTLREIDFKTIYNSVTGYNKYFKILLQMDAEKQTGKEILDIMPRLICDIDLDVDRILKNSVLCNNMDWDVLFKYFAHPKLQLECQRRLSYLYPVPKLSKMPLLQELARDAFRQHFIKTFHIQNAKQFFTLIKLLPISPVYKKIITFEDKLYGHLMWMYDYDYDYEDYFLYDED